MVGAWVETCAELAGIEPPAGRDTCDDEAFTDDLEATCAVVGSAVIVIALSGLSKCS
jgi:hypothetical protein